MEAEELDKILTEIAGYEIQLVEDPTLPEHGTRYLQQCISKCRQYMNRVQYYLQICTASEKILRREISVMETDIELKINGKLADDPIVRRQPSIEDRKAVAISMLQDEHETLSKKRLEFQDLTETIKIIKMKYGDLKSTNADIRMQRQLVRDDKSDQPYEKPGANQDKSIPAGMPPPANKPRMNPSDLLNPETRPDDMPEPKDEAHARQIAAFFNALPEVAEPASSSIPVSIPARAEDNTIHSPGMSYEDLLS